MMGALKIGGAAAVLAVFIAVAPASGGEQAAGITVNGVALPEAWVESEYHWILSQKQMFHPLGEEREEGLRREAADRWVVWEILRQKLAAKGGLVPDDEVEAYFLKTKEGWGSMYESFLTTLGVDEAYHRRRTAAVENFKKYREDFIAAEVTVTDEEILASYREKESAYNSPGSYKAESLQITSHDKSGRLMHASLPDLVSSARRKILDGETIGQMALDSNSSQVTAEARTEDYVSGSSPVFEAALEKLAVGGVSEPVQLTANSYIIFRLLGNEPPRSRSLEEARPEIRAALLNTKGAAIVRAHIEQIKKEADVGFLMDGYAPLPPTPAPAAPPH